MRSLLGVAIAVVGLLPLACSSGSSVPAGAAQARDSGVAASDAGAPIGASDSAAPVADAADSAPEFVDAASPDAAKDSADDGPPARDAQTDTAAPPGVFWVYYDGKFNWGGDYSFSASPDYMDTAGVPEDGPYDIAVTVTGPYGGFQPYAGGTVPMWDFDDTGYSYLVFDLKPTIANQTWTCMFHAVGDIAIGSGVAVTSYGPAPQVGVWSHYKIPLQDLGVFDNGAPTYSGVYKFFIQDQTGVATNLFYADNIGFSP
jgi:hypothetical protein